MAAPTAKLEPTSKVSPNAAKAATPSQGSGFSFGNLLNYANPVYDAEQALKLGETAVGAGVKEAEGAIQVAQKAGLQRDLEAAALAPFDPAASAQLLMGDRTKSTKAATAARKPPRAGSAKNGQATTEATPDTVNVTSNARTPEGVVGQTELANLNRSISSLQASVAATGAELSSIKQSQVNTNTALNGVYSQIGQSAAGASGAAGAVAANAANTGAGNAPGKISSFLTSTTGRIVVVVAVAGGIFYYVRQKGGISKLVK